MLDKYVLENGLRVYFVTDNSKHSTFINLIVNFGGKDSSIYLDNKKINIKSGIAHFIEHYLLECSKYGDLMKTFSDLGIKSNGMTTIDKTIYYIDTVNKDFSYELKLLLDGIHNPVINKKSILSISKPIIEEKKRRLDNKYSALYDKALSNVIKEGKYSTVLGDLSGISTINQNDIKNAYNAFYRPNNEIIVIGGRVDKKKTINLIKNIYDSIDFSNRIMKRVKYKNIYDINKKRSIIYDNINIEKSIITFKIPLNDKRPDELIIFDYYMYYFLKSNIGLTSNLYQELINNNIILGKLEYSSYILDNSFILMIQSYTKNIKLYEETILNYFLNKKFIFDEDLFNLYKKNSVIDCIIRKDNIYSTINPLIENIISFNYEKLDDIDDINKLDFNEYKKTISSLSFNTYSIAIIKRKN